jgi:release factor glutamine methyltransferase
MMTIPELLNWSTDYLKDHRIENPRLNAELLLARSLELTREELYVHFHDSLKGKEEETLEGLVHRRSTGEPLQYILGQQAFWSSDFKVDPRALIPRPETEILVEQAISIFSQRHFEGPPFLLEIGTGSGAIAISLAKEVKSSFIIATDISREALLLAKENAKREGVLGQIEWVNGNLFDPFCLLKGRGFFDVILSNPPYISSPEIERLTKEVKDYEPIVALDGGEDGLKFFRNILSQAPFYLKKDGWLLFEVGQGQSSMVSKLIEEETHFLKPECVTDLSGIERVVKTQKS